MKKVYLFASFLMAGALLTSCGRGASDPGTASGIVEDDPSLDTSTGTGGADAGKGDLPGEGLSEGDPEQGAMDPEMEKALAAKEGSEEWVEEEVHLSDRILKKGDTLQVMHINGENELYPALEFTLKGAKLFDSPEAASLDRTQMMENTENYDKAGEPVWCSIDETKFLVCDLAVKNLEEESDGDLHIGTIMIAYADPDTGKVTIVTSCPAYFPATSSRLEASDYLHYQLAAGESKEMTVGWLIQDEYEIENLYLCVTYDVRGQEERQYFQMAGQE